MATLHTLLLFLAGFLFSTAFKVDDDCDSYFTSSGILRPSQDCSTFQYCCGTCNNRRCCSNPLDILDEDSCIFNGPKISPSAYIGAIIGSIIILIIFFTVCCVCPCCCLYKLCRKPRPVMTTTTHTTVISSQYPQQPVNPGAQYPAYQHVPPQPGYGSQPGYGGQAVPPAPYQGQPYAPGPPPPYKESGPGYPAPYSQAAYDGGYPPYPIQPPTQPGYAQPPLVTDYNTTQPPYNPAFVEPAKPGY